MKKLAFWFSIVIIFFSCSNNTNKSAQEYSCDKSYEDFIFKNKRFYDAKNPKFPIVVSLSEKCNKINDKYYKKLLITDSLFHNDTFLFTFIREDNKIIYAIATGIYAMAMGKNYEYNLLPNNFVKNYHNEGQPFDLDTLLINNNDTIYRYRSVFLKDDCNYFFDISKKNGLINVVRERWKGPFLEL